MRAEDVDNFLHTVLSTAVVRGAGTNDFSLNRWGEMVVGRKGEPSRELKWGEMDVELGRKELHPRGNREHFNR